MSFNVALEEYENLKRIPDPRQAAMQRFQQQQRLNALIAQHQLASNQAIRAQQARPEGYQTLHTTNGQNFDYTRLLQQIQTIGMMHDAIRHTSD